MNNQNVSKRFILRKAGRVGKNAPGSDEAAAFSLTLFPGRFVVRGNWAGHLGNQDAEQGASTYLLGDTHNKT